MADKKRMETSKEKGPEFTRNVEIKKRVRALMLDLLLIKIIELGILGSLFIGLSPFVSGLPLFAIRSFNKYWYGLNILISMIVFFSYFLFCYFTGNGQTIGKRIFELRAINLNSGGELSLKSSLLRALGHFFSYTFYGIPYLISFLRKDQKSPVELCSHTIIVDINQQNQNIQCPLIQRQALKLVA